MLGEPTVDLKLLHAFILVAEERHFGKAAERAFVSVGTMSGRIKDLEQRLGYAVFERTSRHVALTDRGVAFLEEVEGPVRLLETSFANQVSKKPRRTIRFAVSGDASTPAVLGAADRFSAVGYDVVPIIGVDDELFRVLANGQSDIVVAWSNPTTLGHFDLHAEHLEDHPTYMLVRPDDPLVDQQPVTPSLVADRAVVLFQRNFAPDPHDILSAWLSLAGSRSGPIANGNFQQAGMAATMAARSEHVTFATCQGDHGQQRRVQIDPPITTHSWAAVRPEDRDLLDEFVSYVREF